MKSPIRVYGQHFHSTVTHLDATSSSLPSEARQQTSRGQHNQNGCRLLPGLLPTPCCWSLAGYRVRYGTSSGGASRFQRSAAHLSNHGHRVSIGICHLRGLRRHPHPLPTPHQFRRVWMVLRSEKLNEISYIRSKIVEISHRRCTKVDKRKPQAFLSYLYAGSFVYFCQLKFVLFCVHSVEKK